VKNKRVIIKAQNFKNDMALRDNVFPFPLREFDYWDSVFPFGRKGSAMYTTMVDILLGVVDLSTQ